MAPTTSPATVTDAELTLEATALMTGMMSIRGPGRQFSAQLDTAGATTSLDGMQQPAGNCDANGRQHCLRQCPDVQSMSGREQVEQDCQRQFAGAAGQQGLTPFVELQRRAGAFRAAQQTQNCGPPFVT